MNNPHESLEMTGSWNSYILRCATSVATRELHTIVSKGDFESERDRIALLKKRILRSAKDNVISGHDKIWLSRVSFFLSDLDLVRLTPEVPQTEKAPGLLIRSEEVERCAPTLTPEYLRELLKRYRFSNKRHALKLAENLNLQDHMINILTAETVDWWVICSAWKRLPDYLVAERLLQRAIQKFSHLTPTMISLEEECVLALAGHPKLDLEDAMRRQAALFSTAHEAIAYCANFTSLYAAHSYIHARKNLPT